ISEEIVFAGVTMMMLVGAALSPSIGRWLDRGGARVIMTIGSLAAALALFALGLSVGVVSYLFAWAVMGFASAMLLTNPSFVAVAQLAGSKARQAMTVLMLFTGASSSFAWPALSLLDGSLGWRSTCLVLAAFQLLVGAPFHWWLLGDKADLDPQP